MALVLGVAFGPRATSVEVHDADTGALVAEGRARHVDLGPDVDVDDPTAWWRSLVAAVAQAGEREIAAIAGCGSHPGLVLLDGAGAVLRPVQPWADLLELHPDQLGALALAAGPDDDEPVLVQGVPGRAGGVLTGLRAGTSRPGLAWAAFDGVACAALDAIDLLTDAGSPRTTPPGSPGASPTPKSAAGSDEPCSIPREVLVHTSR